MREDRTLSERLFAPFVGKRVSANPSKHHRGEWKATQSPKWMTRRRNRAANKRARRSRKVNAHR